MIQLPGCTVLWLWNSLLYCQVCIALYVHAVCDSHAPPKKSYSVISPQLDIFNRIKTFYQIKDSLIVHKLYYFFIKFLTKKR